MQDTSHSGTVTRAIPLTATEHAARLKLAPVAVVMRTYREHKAFYDKVQLDAARAISASKTPEPTILTIMAAQDNQTAVEGDGNGVFTTSLLAAWDEGRFTGNYSTLLQRVRMRMPSTQSPMLNIIGKAGEFARERPFSVAATPGGQ